MTTSTSPLVDTYPQFPFTVSRGDGLSLYTTDGREYLDLYGGHAVCALGHNNQNVINAITEQASKLFFYSNLAKLEVRDRAAAALIEFADSHLTSAFFCNSGAEANENALKLSVQLTGRKRLVGFKGGWHGRTTMAAAVTDDPKWHAKTPGWTGDVLFLEPNNLEELLKIDASVAAVIVEPIQSIGGVNVVKNDFLSALYDQCEAVGAFLIFDEVQTGVGRTGVPYINGHGHVENGKNNKTVKAHMSTSAKSLANGFPIGALLVNGDIASSIKLGDLGSTFGGGPLAMAAMLATLNVVKEEQLMERAFEFGMCVRDELKELPLIQEIRGSGCLLGLRTTRLAKEVVTGLQEAYILAGTSGVSDVVRLLPPYISGESEVSRLKDALARVSGELA